ncbi:immunoglobulin E-set [Gilbertella persicaria]|uniref:immunoglobulin E-set n=1 Tax=Gilbertella persicaria TaxID=101096 RepID=UPI002220D0A6|nr:immunoglobulin E-set [Gilbertella persicaria]KAI8087720.1 immunoglobulin E-set [Gilbertella persicaria]
MWTTSSFLSFSFRFFILQILRFIMRDWLALPLSPTTNNNNNNNNSSSSNDDDEGIMVDTINQEKPSTWMSLLFAIGAAKKIKQKSTVAKDETHPPPCCTEQEFEQQQQQQQQAALPRILSSSSLTSSTDSDNSTPALSEIIQSSNKYPSNASTKKTTEVLIRWNHGGKKVQVTGEFDNWSGSVDMIPDAEDAHCYSVSIPMNLTKDVEYKFIVDGEWKYAKDLPHRTDWRGNINNVIYKE